ncbi:hypothetical protein [Chryseobacterium sp. C3]|uniref:hypothetical protein n=1 Tax=Chryseobacterium sp. C3 TaxID=2761532 RepID=UPI001626CC7E|nr:hypothetical protein [Chryseobacterium sp. C3]
MRVLTLIFMVLAFLVGGTCSGLLFKNIESRIGSDDYSIVDKAQQQIDDLKKQGIDITKIDDPQVKESLEILEKVPPKWKVDTAGILGIAVTVLAFVMIVIAFMKKNAVRAVSLLVIVLSIAMWIIAPDIEAGKYSGINPKTMALIGFLGLAGSAAFAFMSYQLYLKKLSKN